MIWEVGYYVCNRMISTNNNLIERIQTTGAYHFQISLNTLLLFKQSPLKSVRFSGLSSRPYDYNRSDMLVSFRSWYSKVEQSMNSIMLNINDCIDLATVGSIILMKSIAVNTRKQEILNKQFCWLRANNCNLATNYNPYDFAGVRSLFKLIA